MGIYISHPTPPFWREFGSEAQYVCRKNKETEI